MSFPPVDQDPAEVRDVACHLLAPDAVCNPTTPEPPPEPPDLGWLQAVLQLLVWAALVAVVVLALWALWRALAARRRRRGGADDDDGEVDGDGEPVVVEVEDLPERVIDTVRTPQQWRDEALEHERAGRYREALRCRYRALVGDLARRGVLDELPGRTTGEERAQLRELAPDVAAPFAHAASTFDEVWFGDLPVTAEVHRGFVDDESAVLTGDRAPRERS
jgi:hypothetical protein